jgi:hypothetical protein
MRPLDKKYSSVVNISIERFLSETRTVLFGVVSKLTNDAGATGSTALSVEVSRPV